MTIKAEIPNSSNGSSDHETSPNSQRATLEANEVKSVRKKVEGMGVETETEDQSQPTSVLAPGEGRPGEEEPNLRSSDSKSGPEDSATLNSSKNLPEDKSLTSDRSELKLPSTWDAYASVESPFTAFAPRSTASICLAPLNDSSHSQTEAIIPSPSKPLARAFASPIKSANSVQNHSSCSAGVPSSLGSSSSNFPCGPEFFLKGKRNTPLGGLSSETDTHSSVQHKKLKPALSSDPPLSCSTSAFAAYATSRPMSLRPSALEKLNNDPSLQTQSRKSPLLNLHPPGSADSSVCAVNGDTEESLSPSPSSNSATGVLSRPAHSPSPLGFSSFSKTAGFSNTRQDSNWTDASPSVFEQYQEPNFLKPANGGTRECGEWGGGKSGEGASHLSEDQDFEGKTDGFSVKEVITGEENEDLIKSVRCKVFFLGDDNSWHERGSGALRLLCTKEQPYRYRLIMRADAVLRVLLNVPIFKGFNCQPSQDKFLSFVSPTPVNQTSESEGKQEDGGSTKSQFQQYLCRFGKPEARQEIMDCINDCLLELKSRSDETVVANSISEPKGDDFV
ncbi:hypothetical protein BY996DRAFT_7477922 [Phakopsora pachyrhizi]|uniref:RanBD1 domain-containing protein n=1 Tax=Phakopsora pachyrhizi TaxID=170000 RepID=A0AAV0BQM7_PHAPC|nr:hypothetical protein BY996DRAFT_7477922 [Phakopsora pachyrhizi]CAH7688487.1 hypothetical protein PPACK8108_LOCUS23459 [Phakopsora pachyrhizi]